MVAPLSMPDTDDCVADLRHLKPVAYVVYFDENNIYIYLFASNNSQIKLKTS